MQIRRYSTQSARFLMLALVIVLVRLILLPLLVQGSLAGVWRMPQSLLQSPQTPTSPSSPNSDPSSPRSSRTSPDPSMMRLSSIATSLNLTTGLRNSRSTSQCQRPSLVPPLRRVLPRLKPLFGVGGYKGKVRNAGLGTTLAVTHGQASTFHYDNNNSDGCYTVLCCLGDEGSKWDNSPRARGDKEGGGKGIFQMPELGISTPFRPGNCIFFCASMIAHRVTKVSTLPSAVGFLSSFLQCSLFSHCFRKGSCALQPMRSHSVHVQTHRERSRRGCLQL